MYFVVYELVKPTQLIPQVLAAHDKRSCSQQNQQSSRMCQFIGLDSQMSPYSSIQVYCTKPDQPTLAGLQLPQQGGRSVDVMSAKTPTQRNSCETYRDDAKQSATYS